MNEVTNQMQQQLARAIELLEECTEDYTSRDKDLDNRVAEALLLLTVFRNDLMGYTAY